VGENKKQIKKQQVFPTSGRHWLSYANTFVAENRKPKAIGVLQAQILEKYSL
jgi:hypothetical protein